ncbi:MAG TPA: hypothetical protein DEO86_03090 [Colwellia sp.]|jgi:predicted small lipoprotein YifL|nr:hypothetical protein [Colwellia sp.]|tara:strand:+ start:397 stop:720 length:324 start_codon:yes stop_codon:yes gene_type:complete
MRTIRLHYLHQKLDQKLKLKSILLALVAATSLSACGIKGKLYQTPEQAVTPNVEAAAQGDDSKEQSVSENVESQSVTMLEEAQKKQVVQSPIEQTVGQSTDQVKEQQ